MTLLLLMLFFCFGVGWYMLIEKVNAIQEDEENRLEMIHREEEPQPSYNHSQQYSPQNDSKWFALPPDWNPPNYQFTKGVFDRYTDTAYHTQNEHHHAKIMNQSIIYLTYGEKCCKQAVKRGCSAFLSITMNGNKVLCLPFSQQNVDTLFIIQHRDHFTNGKEVGAGYWLWKPYLIHKILHDDAIMQEGDFLFYSDAGAFLVGPIHPLLLYMHLTNASYLFFETPHKQAVHCKRDSFVRQRCDAPECHEAIQVSTAYSVWRKDAEARQVAKEWLEDAKDFQSISDKPNIHGLKNLFGFKSHGHDQCILTNVLTRRGRRGGVDPSLAFMVVHDGSKL